MPYIAGSAGSGGGSGGGTPTPPTALGYHHLQTEAATQWIIPHGLGFRPAGVQVSDTDGNPVEGLVTHPDLLTTHLHFDVPIAGSADLS